MDLLNMNRNGFAKELLRKVFRMRVQVIVKNSTEYVALCNFLKEKELLDEKFVNEIDSLNPYNQDFKGKMGVSLSTYGVKNFGTKRRVKVQALNLEDYELWINFSYFKEKVIDIASKHGWN